MDVSPYEAGLVRFLMDKFKLGESNAIKILRNDKTRKNVLELFNLYLGLRAYGYDFAPIEYRSPQTLEEVLKLLTAINREVLSNPQLSENEKRALMHVLRALDLEAELKNEGPVVVTDRFMKRVSRFVIGFARLFDETKRTMQVNEKMLAELFEEASPEVEGLKSLNELKANINLAGEVLRRCKKLDVMKRIKETAYSTLWNRSGEWYDRRIKGLLVDVLRASGMALSSRGCSPGTIVRVVLQGNSALVQRAPQGSPDEVLAPFVQFVRRQVDLIGGILYRKPKALELLALSQSKMAGVERDFVRIRDSLRTDLEMAPWEVIINAKRLDELEREICSSIKPEVELSTTDNIEALLEVVKHLERLCPRVRPIVKIEFRQEG